MLSEMSDDESQQPRKPFLLPPREKSTSCNLYPAYEKEGVTLPDLSDHLKSGQRLSLQNRPMAGAGTKDVVP
jgi:hypothetical protein